jgi:methyltransferase family protein
VPRTTQRKADLLTSIWLRVGARLARRGHHTDLWGSRYALVERLAPGRTFLDLGGMWDVAGDVAFAAERAGATRVVLFDGMDPSSEFSAKHAEAGSQVTYVQGDLHDPVDVERLGKFDVVWCAGVIYHSPNPYQQLFHLRRLTRRHLLLGSHVIPEVPGIENACVFYPGRSEESLAAFWKVHGQTEGFPGMTRPFDETPLLAYANMWWGLTPSAIRSMLRYAGFRVLEEFSPFWYFRDFLCEATGEPEFLPPLGFSRARGDERLAGVPSADRPGWAPPE